MTSVNLASLQNFEKRQLAS